MAAAAFEANLLPNTTEIFQIHMMSDSINIEVKINLK